MGSPSTARCFTANSVLYCSLSPIPKSMAASPPSMSPTDSFLLNFFIGFSVFSLLLLFSVLAWERTQKRRLLANLKLDEEPELVTDSAGPDVSSLSALKLYLSKISENPDQTSCQKNPTHLSQSLLIELLTSKNPNWSSLFPSAGDPGGVRSTGLDDSRGGCCPGDGEMSGEEPEGKKRKKKRGKKNKQSVSNPVDLKTNGDVGEMRDVQKKNGGSTLTSKEDLVCLYPFTSSSSATQRKIKQHYDQLLTSRGSKGLTPAQVGQFVDSLVVARNELQQKSEVIRRKFTITKALLLRADRSSFDRLRQQLYKLEAEQKRLEEDAFVYNWLQHQLKLSPAYKKMLETNASREMEAKSSVAVENAEADTDFADISFEELLAQEKKDSFWQKHGKQRLSSYS